jgi:hypothetical protein
MARTRERLDESDNVIDLPPRPRVPNLKGQKYMGRYVKGHRDEGGGRKKGVRNRMTRVMREAVVLAAEAEGLDGRGKDGLVGYLRMIARKDYEVYAGLLRAVLPLQITGVDDGPIKTELTVREARAELERRGIPVQRIFALPPPDAVDVVEGVFSEVKSKTKRNGK